MPSLWGSSRGEDGGSVERQSEDTPVSEHTRLLPNRLYSNDGQLSPDDPAVTPFNLWTIRALWLVTVALTVVTSIWWTLLLVSTFATGPALYIRGSVFFAFAYTTIALTTTVLTLVFFGVPSQSMRQLCVFMAAVFFIDFIVMIAVEQTRIEERWVGLVSIGWAFLISLWAMATDFAVQRGKREEEERLTGRVETRRTLVEWIAVFLSTVVLLGLSIVAALITLALILRALDAGTGPPGDRYWVEGGKYRLHVYCEGNTTASGGTVPTVLLEGGGSAVEDGLWQVAREAIEEGSISRFCFVDRPGFAWSDTAPSPLSAGMAAVAISEALAQANEHGPWVLASSGIGSVYSRIFSSQHGPDVSGLLLIDALHEDYLSEIGSAKRGFAWWFWGVLSPLGLKRIPGALFGGRTSVDRIWGRSSRQNSKYLFARLQESLVADSFTKRELASSRIIQLKDTPLVVVTSGLQLKELDGWEQRQRDLTHLTDNLKDWEIVAKAPHRVWEHDAGRDAIKKQLGRLVREGGSS